MQIEVCGLGPNRKRAQEIIQHFSWAPLSLNEQGHPVGELANQRRFTVEQADFFEERTTRWKLSLLQVFVYLTEEELDDLSYAPRSHLQPDAQGRYRDSYSWFYTPPLPTGTLTWKRRRATGQVVEVDLNEVEGGIYGEGKGYLIIPEKKRRTRKIDRNSEL